MTPKPLKIKLILLTALMAAGIGFDLLPARSQPYPDPPWALDAGMVGQLETRAVMPPGAKPIDAFTRYYVPGYDHGRRVVYGLLKEGGDKHIHFSNGPIIMDGGCSVVELVFDVTADQMTSIKCHGP
jgi:hypothetical protein